jgi:hypothetical protein
VRHLLTVFQNSLSDSTNVFKLAEITLDINEKTIWFPCIFYLFFPTSPGILLSDFVYLCRRDILKRFSTGKLELSKVATSTCILKILAVSSHNRTNSTEQNPRGDDSCSATQLVPRLL